MKKIAIVAALGVAAFLLFRSEVGKDLEWSALLKTIRAKYPEVKQVSTEALAQRLAVSGSSTASSAASSAVSSAESLKQIVLLDTRTPEEYRVSRIGNAINVSPDATEFPMLDSLPKDTPIVAYCSVGYRSSEIAQRLADAGFTNVENLEGSIFKWANEGRPVQSSTGPVQEVHPYNPVWGKFLQKELRATGE